MKCILSRFIVVTTEIRQMRVGMFIEHYVGKHVD